MKNYTRWLVVAILLMTFALRAPGMVEKLSWDEGMYAYISSQMLHGAVPHKDIPGEKEAGIFFLYAGIFKVVGQDSFSVRLVGAVWVTVAAYLIFLLGRRLYGDSGGLTAAFLFGIGMSGHNCAAILTNTEVWMTLLSVATWFLAYIAVKDDRKAFYTYAGVAGGLNFCLKVTAVLDLTGVVFFILVCALFFGDKDRLRWVIGAKLRLVAGFAIGIAPLVIYLAATGALGDAWQQVFVWRVQHVQQAQNATADKLSMFMASYQRIMYEQAGVMIAASISAIYIIIKDRRRETLLPIIWCAVSLPSIAITGRYAPYYFPFAIPALAMVSGYGLGRLADRTTFRRVGIVFVCLYLITSAAYIVKADKKYDKQFYYAFKQYIHGDIDADGIFRQMHPDVACAYDAARYIREHSAPTDRVFFWTWSGEFYWEAGRPRSTRHLLESLPSRDPVAEKALGAEIFADIKRNPPEFFVLRDILMRTVVPPYRAVDALENAKELKAYLDANYSVDTVFGRAIVYRRDAPGKNHVSSVVMFPERMNPTRGYIKDGDWLMYDNGSFTGGFDVPKDGPASVTVRAWGLNALGKYPVIKLTVDGAEVSTFSVAEVSRDYVFPVDIKAGRHTVKLEFANNAWDPAKNQGRQLFVSRVVVRW